MIPRFDIPAICERYDLAAVASRVVALKRAGRYLKGLCPFHAEKSPSFVVEGAGAAAHFHCFGCGAHGDVIGFVMRVEGKSFVEAAMALSDNGALNDPAILARLQDAAALRLATVESDRRARQAEERARSRRIWRETETAGPQAVVRRYFEGRAIDIAALPGGKLPEDIRFHPALAYWHRAGERDKAGQLAILPAIVAAIRGADFKGVGIEITWLAPDGSGKAALHDPETGAVLPAKKMRGNPWGGAVRLGPAAETMGFCEGKESGLSVMLARPDLPVWACLSIGNMAGPGRGRGRRIPLPDGRYRYLESPIPDLNRPSFAPPPECRVALLLQDADNADPDNAAALYARAAARWIAADKQVIPVVPPEGMDFNDMIRRDVMGRAA